MPVLARTHSKEGLAGPVVCALHLKIRGIFAASAAGAKETTSTMSERIARCVSEGAQESTQASAPKAPGRLGQRRCKELSGAEHYNAPRPVIIDVIVVLVLVVALIVGFQRGVIQPLMAEIFFFGTLLVLFRFHDQYTALLARFHINAVLSVFFALIIAVILGAVGGAIGGAFHRMEAIRGIDGLLGLVVHVGVSLVVIYLAVSALVTLDNAFEPALKSANLTLAQVNQLENQILSNPITAAMVSKSDLDTLKKNAQRPGGAHLDSVGGIHQLQQLFTDFMQPQLHGSRTVPFILSIGQHMPFIGHVGPKDLHPLPSASASPKASPSPSASPTKS